MKLKDNQYYALKDKNFDFICISKTIDSFNKKINECYYNRKMCQPKGNNFTEKDFLRGGNYKKIKITIEYWGK